MMKNFVFISPNFPENYWHFCKELQGNGINVLGIGDQPYHELRPEVRDSLNEYYKVSTLENYDEVYRAVAFFIFRYGRIDWLESNNEYWLERDAQLRQDFHIMSGWQVEDLPRIKYKSRMKEYYQKVGIPTARYHMVDDFEHCMRFIDEVHFPVIVKPDNGVGASHTYKLSSEDDLRTFLATREPVSYIMEEFIDGEVQSYDAIIDSHGEPLFETGNRTPNSIMDIVNNEDNTFYYILRDLPDDTREAGRKTVKSFGVRSRFIHFEFFRLLKDHEGLGKKGQIIALEVNMRPCGGISPEMMNYANSTDVYKIYADMIAYDSTLKSTGERAFCAFFGRRDAKHYRLSSEELAQKYAPQMRQHMRVPEALSGAMSNEAFIAVFPTQEALDQFARDASDSAD